ncbi:MAG: CGGC domain-containing protein [Desulfovermiculus sp.]|nr:CGGC domain-containing protein [Desulfovermiculus sp.]
MTAIGLLRCPENETKCPLTNCFRSLFSRQQGFTRYDEHTDLAGVFTIQSDMDATLDLAKILQAKGAEAIHVVTCAFAHKGEGKTWHLENGFISNVDDLCAAISQATGLPCVKGSAHLPQGYIPEVFRP